MANFRLMNPVSLILGMLALFYGFMTLYLRRVQPEKLGKLEPMKQRFGEKPAYIIHMIMYSIVPIIVGILLITSSFMTES